MEHWNCSTCNARQTDPYEGYHGAHICADCWETSRHLSDNYAEGCQCLVCKKHEQKRKQAAA